MSNRPLIESDKFDFEYLSRLGERELAQGGAQANLSRSQMVGKSPGNRLSRNTAGMRLDENAKLSECLYKYHSFSGLKVFDPFMGSGTTVGEAHKLGFTALGRDINPVAVETVRVALGPLNRQKIREAFAELSQGVGKTIREFYLSKDSKNRACDVLYFFWVMQAACPHCQSHTDLFSKYIIARNANANKSTVVQICCPSCGLVFPGQLNHVDVSCPSCQFVFAPEARGSNRKTRLL